MPPITGAAIRFMTSDPVPVAHNDWYQAQERGGHGHELRAQTFDCPLPDGLLQLRQRAHAAFLLLDRGELLQRNLPLPSRSGHQHSAQGAQVAAEVAHVARVHRTPFPERGAEAVYLREWINLVRTV